MNYHTFTHKMINHAYNRMSLVLIKITCKEESWKKGPVLEGISKHPIQQWNMIAYTTKTTHESCIHVFIKGQLSMQCKPKPLNSNTRFSQPAMLEKREEKKSLVLQGISKHPFWPWSMNLNACINKKDNPAYMPIPLNPIQNTLKTESLEKGAFFQGISKHPI